jgi:hypothetical protein
VYLPCIYKIKGIFPEGVVNWCEFLYSKMNKN